MDATADTALEVLSGREQGVRGSLAAGEILIGRDPDCDLVLTDPRVSRRHARIWVESGLLLIEDAESTAGTLVNGASIERALPLRIGDQLQLGTTELVVRWTPAPAATMIGVVPPELRDTGPATAATQIPTPAVTGPAPLPVPEPADNPTPISTPAPAPDLAAPDLSMPAELPPPESLAPPLPEEVPVPVEMPAPPPLDLGPPTAIAPVLDGPPPPVDLDVSRADSFPPLPPPWTAPEAPKKPWFKRLFGG
jgi:pSer/pThr/pTyr-binding forkhead associated (FHA) protein